MGRQPGHARWRVRPPERRQAGSQTRPRPGRARTRHTPARPVGPARRRRPRDGRHRRHPRTRRDGRHSGRLQERDRSRPARRGMGAGTGAALRPRTAPASGRVRLHRRRPLVRRLAEAGDDPVRRCLGRADLATPGRLPDDGTGRVNALAIGRQPEMSAVFARRHLPAGRDQPPPRPAGQHARTVADRRPAAIAARAPAGNRPASRR